MCSAGVHDGKGRGARGVTSSYTYLTSSYTYVTSSYTYQAVYMTAKGAARVASLALPVFDVIDRMYQVSDDVMLMM